MGYKTTVTRPDQPKDKTILLGSVLSATTEDLEAAVRYVQFELDQRAARDENGETARRLTEERTAEVADTLAKFNELTAPLEGTLNEGEEG